MVIRWLSSLGVPPCQILQNLDWTTEDGPASMNLYIMFLVQTLRARIRYLNDNLVHPINGVTFAVAQGMLPGASII